MKLWRNTLIGCLAAALFMLMSSVSSAQTINDIVKRGKIQIGVNSGAPPFSFVGSDGKAQGLDVDLANLFGHYLGVPVEITTYTTAARIPALQAKKVDLLIATLTATPERAKAVMFTGSYNVFPIIIASHKGASFGSIADLRGKKVGVAGGTPQEAALMQAAPKDAVLSRFNDDLTAAQALLAGQVDAVAIPETIFKEIVTSRPGADIAIKLSMHDFFQSIAVRTGSFELLQWLNTTLAYVKGNGELDKISMKWTGHPMPKNMPVF